MDKPFIHLRTLSSYSLSESTLKVHNLVNHAKLYNMPSIAITDNNNMFGVFEFSQECIKNNIQPIIGTSINLLDVSFKNQISQISSESIFCHFRQADKIHQMLMKNFINSSVIWL